MPTALVTGASAGLGAIFAQRLAVAGHDLVLTARRGELLEALAERLRACGREVRVQPVDLAVPGAAEGLAARLEAAGVQIDLLVNNAGFGAHGTVSELERRVQVRMVELNCRSLIELTHAVLPGMLERRAGGILNVASTAAFQAGPYMAVYYATKAFVLSFSEALHEEVRTRGVRVTALCPGPTRGTEFASVSQLGDSRLFRMFAGDPERVVSDGLRALEDNRAVCVSGWRNRLATGSVRFAPRPLVRRMAAALQRTR